MIIRTVCTLLGYYVTLGLFGAFGFALNVFALMAGCLPRTDSIERFAQRLIHWNLALFIWWTTATSLVKVRYHGLDRLPPSRRGLVLVANHPGLLDITFLLARLPEAVCIFKPSIRRNPLLGASARLAGYLANDGGIDLLRLASDKVRAGHILIVFPEGTRTPPGTAFLPFRSGFVLIARRAGAPIQLVRIVCDRCPLAKGQAWWKPAPLPAVVNVTIGPCIAVSPDTDTGAATAEVEAWFRSPAPPGSRQPAQT